MNRIELREHDCLSLPSSALSMALGRVLYHRFGKFLSVEFPSYSTRDCWRITSKGYVGVLPLDRDNAIAIHPKVPIGSVLRMLDYARDTRFEVLAGLVQFSTLEEIYERLANLLAQWAMVRVRRGLYRTYLDCRDDLAYMRGRVDVERRMRLPWRVELPCRYRRFTADVEDNQILAWTLYLIARTGLCREPTASTVRGAMHAFQRLVSLERFVAADCLNRSYHRLNEDYRPLHALCRFFLEHSGPTLGAGDHACNPFVVNMPALFEAFVGRWLRKHLGTDFNVRLKERLPLGSGAVITMTPDIVVYDATTGQALMVLDTKYKADGAPPPGDVYQVMAYAAQKGCTQAVLVYPQSSPVAFDERVRDVRVRRMAFSLDGDLDAAGRMLIRQLADLLDG